MPRGLLEHIGGNVTIAASALEAHLERASAALDAASGTSSLCSLSRSGVPIPGIKYPEGAWSALREVERSARSGGDIRDHAIWVRERWQADLAAHHERGSGPDWIAYLTGGVDALDALLDTGDGQAAPSAD